MQHTLPSGSSQIVIEFNSIPPNLKNTKVMGKGRMWTDPKVKRWMKVAADSLLSQLKYHFQTTSDGTLMASQIRSLMLSSLPADDSWRFIPSLKITGKLALDGQPKCRVTIEKPVHTVKAAP